MPELTAPAAAPAPASPQAQDSSPALVPSIADGIDALSDNPEPSQPQPKAQEPAPEPAAKPPEATKAPAPPAPPAPPAAAPKPEDDDLPLAPKAQEQPPEAAKPQEHDTSNWKGLRGAYAQSKEQVEKLTSEISQLRQQVEASKRTGIDEATKALNAELESMRAKVKEADERMRYVDYKASSEYRQKFQEPLEKAWRAAADDIKGFTFQDENGTEHAVTNDTLAQIVNLPTVQASQLANKIFGTAATEIMAHRRAILGLNNAAREAEQVWKSKGDELTQAQTREREQMLASAEKTYNDHFASLRATAPQYFERPTDPTEAKYYDKGAAWVDKAIWAKGLPDGLTPEQRRTEVLKAQATVATRAMAYGPLLHRYHAVDAKVKELEKQLSAFKSSTPKTDGGKTEPTPAKPQTFADAIDALPSIGR